MEQRHIVIRLDVVIISLVTAILFMLAHIFSLFARLVSWILPDGPSVADEMVIVAIGLALLLPGLLWHHYREQHSLLITLAKTETIAQREHDFADAVLATASSIIILDLEGRIVHCNRACEALVGYSRSEIIGHCYWTQFLTPDDAVLVKAAFADIQAGCFPSTWEQYWQTRTGNYCLVKWTYSVLHDENDEITSIIVTVMDITKQRDMENQLRASHEIYQSLIVQMSDGLLLIDTATRRVLETNPVLQRLLGYSADELRALTINDIVAHDRAEIDTNLQRVLALGYDRVEQRVYRRKDGTLISVTASGKAVTTTTTTILCIVVRASLAMPRLSISEATREFLSGLSAREGEVFQHLVEGESDIEIATALGISPGTVHNHLNAIYNELDVHKRSEAIAWAIHRGLFNPPPTLHNTDNTL